ncbi:MAG: cytochrome c4 [Agarilytica sp.]
MKNLVLKSFLSVSLIGLSFGATAGGDISNGEKIAKAECVACHGENGNSATPMFPKLAGLGEKYLLKQLLDIQNGDGKNPKAPSRNISEMAGLLDSKSDQELLDLASYYAAQSLQLSGAKEIQVQVNSGAKIDGIELGTQVYRAGNLETGVPACTGCHSPRGLGNAPAGFPRIGGQHADYIEKQLRAFRAGDRTNDADGAVMREVAAKMTDAEIIAVSNFISGLN